MTPHGATRLSAPARAGARLRGGTAGYRVDRNHPQGRRGDVGVDQLHDHRLAVELLDPGERADRSIAAILLVLDPAMLKRGPFLRRHAHETVRVLEVQDLAPVFRLALVEFLAVERALEGIAKYHDSGLCAVAAGGERAAEIPIEGVLTHVPCCVHHLGHTSRR